MLIFRRLFAFIACFLLLFLLNCQALRQARNFGNCEFSLVSLNKLSMAGVNVLGAKSVEELNFQDLLTLGMILLTNPEFPLTMQVSVEVRNPNKVLAAMNRMEYICLIDNREVLTGVMEERVEIPPQGSQTFPMNLSIDLKKVFSKQESRNAIIGFGLNLLGNKQQPSRFTIKARPSIRIGKRYLMYPGYIKFNDNMLPMAK